MSHATTSTTVDLLRGLAVRAGQAVDLEKADAYADGCAGEPFASARASRLMKKAGVDGLEEFRYAEIPIRTIAGGLNVARPTVVADDMVEDQLSTAAEVDAVLAELWKVNQLAEEVNSRLWDDCSRYGQGFLFVWPVTEEPAGPDTLSVDLGDDLGEDPDLTLDDGPAGPAIVDVEILVRSPHEATAVYAPGNSTRLEFVIEAWDDDTTSPPTRHASLYYDDRIERWATVDGHSPDKPESWVLSKTQVHGYGQPFHHFRNRRPVGRPEHELGYGPQQMINKLVTADAASIDFSVWPQRYYLADPKIDDPLANLGDPDFPEDEDDDPEDPDATSALRSDPAAVWKLYARGVGQFDPAQPDLFIARLNWYISAMAQLTGIPEHHFGRGTGQTPSGAALRTLEAPTNEIRRKRRETYGPVLAGSLEHALALLGFVDWAVQVVWQPTATVTDAEGWATISQMVATGVPFEAAVQLAGYTAEQAADWASGADGTDLGRRLALLQGLTGVLPGLLELASAFDPPAPVPAELAGVPSPPDVPVEEDLDEGDDVEQDDGQDPPVADDPPPPVLVEPVPLSPQAQQIQDAAFALLMQALAGVQGPEEMVMDGK